MKYLGFQVGGIIQVLALFSSFVLGENAGNASPVHIFPEDPENKQTGVYFRSQSVQIMRAACRRKEPNFVKLQSLPTPQKNGIQRILNPKFPGYYLTQIPTLLLRVYLSIYPSGKETEHRSCGFLLHFETVSPTLLKEFSQNGSQHTKLFNT